MHSCTHADTDISSRSTDDILEYSHGLFHFFFNVPFFLGWYGNSTNTFFKWSPQAMALHRLCGRTWQCGWSAQSLGTELLWCLFLYLFYLYIVADVVSQHVSTCCFLVCFVFCFFSGINVSCHCFEKETIVINQLVLESCSCFLWVVNLLKLTLFRGKMQKIPESVFQTVAVTPVIGRNKKRNQAVFPSPR